MGPRLSRAFLSLFKRHSLASSLFRVGDLTALSGCCRPPLRSRRPKPAPHPRPSTLTLVRPRRRLTSVPTAHSLAVARSGRQGRRFFSAAEGLSLTDASTTARYLPSGCGLA